MGFRLVFHMELSILRAMNPSVTVIIPTYNHAHFLKRALDSVIQQTYENWVAIVVNNFSTDNTVELVNSYNDSRITLINFNNQGVIAAARNQGIKTAQTEYVAFLDSDDYWEPQKLEQCLRAFEQNQDLGLVCHNEWLVENGRRKLVLEYGPVEKASYPSMLYKGNCVSTSAVVVKKSWLEKTQGFREEKKFNTGEDYDLWMRLAKAGCRYHFLPQTLGEYLVHSTSSSASVEKHLSAVIEVVKDHFLHQPQSFISNLKFRCRLGVLYYGAGRQAYAQNIFPLAFKYFIKSLYLKPFNWKTHVGLGLCSFGYIFKMMKLK